MATLLQRIVTASRHVGLPAWFVAIDLVWPILQPVTLGVDARHYQRATNAWLAGGDPWAVKEFDVQFAATPHTLLFYVPTSVLPLWLSTAVWLALGLVAAIWLIRRLGLPLWWLAFPPLVQAVWNGNPQTIAVALLVAGGPIAATVAVGLKAYTAAILSRRWRDLAFVAVALLVTLPLLPLRDYLAHRGNADFQMASAWSLGAWELPILVVPTILALWLLRRDGAEWLIVPTLWPGMQFYYVSTALPALPGRTLLAAALALPAPLAALLAVIGFAAWRVASARGWVRASPPTTAAVAPSVPEATTL